jgi:hypothetical protein
MTENTKRYYDLWEKDINIDFDPEEFSFLKKQIKNKKFTVTYGFYNKESSQKKQIALIINTDPFMTRRTGVENNWEYIQSREMTDLEIEEYINYYFRPAFKRFLVFYYRDIERLIIDDQKLKAVTPPVFIKMCQDKGYAGKYQTRLEFN